MCCEERTFDRWITRFFTTMGNARFWLCLASAIPIQSRVASGCLSGPRRKKRRRCLFRKFHGFFWIPSHLVRNFHEFPCHLFEKSYKSASNLVPLSRFSHSSLYFCHCSSLKTGLKRDSLEQITKLGVCHPHIEIAVGRRWPSEAALHASGARKPGARHGRDQTVHFKQTFAPTSPPPQRPHSLPVLLTKQQNWGSYDAATSLIRRTTARSVRFWQSQRSWVSD